MAKPALHFQRFEFKYYLPQSTADKLVPALLRHMDWDTYIAQSSQDYYQVNSLYFESPDYRCFWEKEYGISDRRKLRFRYYGPHRAGSPLFLEIKRKRQSLVIKDRVLVMPTDGDAVSLEFKLRQMSMANPENQFLKELVWFKTSYRLQPKLYVTYRRKAFFGKADNRLRVTFDYNIQAQRATRLAEINEKNLQSVYPGGVVLEVKFNNTLPFWFHEMIQQYQLQMETFSKYANSLRSVDPKFDDNNYTLPDFTNYQAESRILMLRFNNSKNQSKSI